MAQTLPLLLVPGLLCSARLYSAQITALWPHGQVAVADHRRDDTMEAIAVRILADAPPRFALAGLSMGGTLTCWLAAHHPEIAGIVCVNPAVEPPAESFMDIFQGSLDSGLETIPGIGNDVADPDSIGPLISTVVKTFGPIDILVNNAGIYEFGPLEAITPDHFHKQFNLNVLGLLLVTQAAVAHFTVAPRAATDDDLQAGFTGELYELAQVLVSVPGPLVFNLLVVDPENIGGDDVDAASAKPRR